MPCLNVQRWIPVVSFCSHGSYLRELFVESLNISPGYLLEHKHSASLLMYSYFRPQRHHLRGEMMGPVYPACSPACLPKNTFKSSEFKFFFQKITQSSVSTPVKLYTDHGAARLPPTIKQQADIARSPTKSWEHMRDWDCRQRKLILVTGWKGTLSPLWLESHVLVRSQAHAER